MYLKNYKTLPITLLILILFMIPVLADSTEKKAAESIPRTGDELEVDGKLSEDLWKNALTYELKYEINPGDNLDALVKTTAYIIHTDSYLYVGFKCYDTDIENVRAHLTDRDSSHFDDQVGFALDTFNDERRSYNFKVNPYGIQTDYIETTNGSDASWDAIWDAAGTIHDWGWSAEFKIPFSSLKFQRSELDQVWGFDPFRIYNRDRYYILSSHKDDRDNNCNHCQYEKIKGFAGIAPGKDLELTPTITSIRTAARDDIADDEFGDADTETDLGLTAKWGITNNSSIGATINPDFSQVESDSLQLDINSPFALSYQEKRPFFVENSDYFSTMMRVLYTRSFRDPNWGLKYTGKEAGHTIGAYLVEDDVTNIIIPGATRSRSISLNQKSKTGVMRYKYDIGNQYTIGAIGTFREGDNYHNRVVGVDGALRFNNQNNLSFQYLGSFTEYPDEIAHTGVKTGEEIKDTALYAMYSFETRNFDWYASYRDWGEDFRADAGFMPQVGFKKYHTIGVYKVIPDQDEFYSLITFETSLFYMEDQEGHLLQRYFGGTVSYEGDPLRSHAVLDVNTSTEAYNGIEFNLTRALIHNCFNPDGNSHAWINYYFGDEIDYANTRKGDWQRISPGIEYRFGKHLFVSYSHNFDRMDIEDERLYTANTDEVYVQWHFNSRSFLRAIVQYLKYEYTPELYTFPIEPEFKTVAAQILYSYKLNPQTVCFIGYTTNYLGDNRVELTEMGHTIFFKLGYAWSL